MSLAKKCISSFDAASRMKGQAYYSSGMVRDFRIDENNVYITATVRGSQANDYIVELDLSDPDAEEIVGRCTCERYQSGSLCKHIWAVLLANDQHVDAVTSPRPKVAMLHESKIDPDGDDFFEPEFNELSEPILELLPTQLRSLMGVK